MVPVSRPIPGTPAATSPTLGPSAIDRFSARPTAQGLYDPGREHDACGIAFVADMAGRASRAILDDAVVALENLDHRGAVGAEVDSGDGAGILLQVPDAFLRRVAATDGIDLPAPGHWAVGTAFLPTDRSEAQWAVDAVERIAAEEGLEVLGWREVPVDASMIGATARSCMPMFRQIFVAGGEDTTPCGIDLDRRCWRVVKRAGHEAGVYFPSFSARTLVYKGMLTTSQLTRFFPDLREEDMVSALALVHSRFSTNTFPSWPLAQPFSMVAHNGEINTVQGNRNWMAAREGWLESDVLGDLEPLKPICAPGESDSASFNSVLELLHLAGRPLTRSVMMMIPQAWENDTTLPAAVRDLHAYDATLMEPWDGPAAMIFTDGTVIGAVLDRNGLRPGRWWVTDDGLVVLASEAGVLDVAPDRVVRKGRLEPGRIFLVDTAAGRIVGDDEIKADLAAERPYGRWLAERTVRLEELPPREHVAHTASSVVRRQQTFGYTTEELGILLAPMATTGAEPIGAMGTDTPVAVLSSRSRLLFDYFSQLFAQVTNPPLDAIREELVTSLSGVIGPEPNLLADTPEHARKLVLPFPVVDNDDLARIVRIDRYAGASAGLRATVIRCLYPVAGGGAALERRLGEIFAEVDAAMDQGANLVVLSDRESNSELAPIPSLLATSAVHHHLVRTRRRTQMSLIVEAGDVREVHHVALLVGYGAACVNPYLGMESVEGLVEAGDVELPAEKAVANYLYALGKGVLKVMSKMGISTVASYRGAQVFQALGLAQDLVDTYFAGTSSLLGGIGLDQIAAEVAARHARAYPPSGISPAHRILETGGEYKWRREGEEHLFDPETIARLQWSTRAGDYAEFKRYTSRVDDQSRRLLTLRGLLRLRTGSRPPIPIEQVESVESIMRRFSTGAMSYGSISIEAHETLAVAMNAIGARSNTGEGGEDADRLRDPRRRSAVKQVASARFGVTADYLTNADDLQIKIAQGAKPGEGGQLPGPKVYPWIARTRHSTPGVGLISPPPHHDIYSIEDIAQLIHDLKNANPSARVHVKLVSEVGVGTVAAGVSKAHADVVLVSGHDGGTGASPLTSLKHAGAPWELGLAETQQTLVLNNLRDRIVVQVDGQLRTGRDVVIGALLGAEEFGFATAPLVVTGCVMMRVCHADTCPVGIATQNPELRARYTGRPEDVVTFFRFLAQEVRELLASLGRATLEEVVGHVELLDAEAAVDHWKASGLDLAPILARPRPVPGAALHRVRAQDHGLAAALDNTLIARAAGALERGEPVRIETPIRNVNRTVGTMLGHELTRRYGAAGLPPDTIDVTLTGSAGQSLGAFLPPGITLRLVGDANDYAAKGLSGGRVLLRPHPEAGFEAAANVIVGNVVGYGATSGELLARGRAGERFAVRNSGATLLAEGVGDHACEYMTGGRVVVLGTTGRNFGAGMSGGRAYVLDLDPDLVSQAALQAGDLTLEALGEADVDALRDLLRRHAQQTGSEVAERLLDEPDWPERFTTVLPVQYARITRALDAVRAQGLDPDTAEGWARTLEVAGA